MEASEEFRGLFRQEYRSIVWSVHLVLGDFARSEEIAQEAFIRMLERWDRVSEYERPGAWLRQVAVRLAIRAKQRDERRPSAEWVGTTSVEPAPVDPDLVVAIRRLPAKQSVAVALHYFEDLPVREIAEIMGCSTATVSTHLHRARLRLSELLGEEAADVD